MAELNVVMVAKYVAFDIETAKDIPGRDFDWRPHRPLGITCIASMSSACNEPRIWCSSTDGTPSAQMSCKDLVGFVEYLESLVAAGYQPLTWNGLGFDYEVLAEESQLIDCCRRQALSHVDMMFHVVCEKGFPVSLANAAAGMGPAGKLQEIDGCDAPKLWSEGQHDTVIRYVAQDVRSTLELGIECDRRKAFRWRTGRGTIASMPLPRGWLSVKDAMLLPQPDVSWMANPIHRDDYSAWLA